MNRWSHGVVESQHFEQQKIIKRDGVDYGSTKGS